MNKFGITHHRIGRNENKNTVRMCVREAKKAANGMYFLAGDRGYCWKDGTFRIHYKGDVSKVLARMIPELIMTNRDIKYRRGVLEAIARVRSQWRGQS